MGWTFGKTIDGSTTRQELGSATREIDFRRAANAARLWRDGDLLAEDGALTRRLPQDPEDADACALLLARGVWGGRSEAASTAAVARPPQIAPRPAA